MKRSRNGLHPANDFLRLRIYCVIVDILNAMAADKYDLVITFIAINI